MKRRVCVVITAPASYARIKSALRAISRHLDLDLQLVVGGSAVLSRFGDTCDFIAQDGFEVAARVYMVIEGDNPIASAKSTGLAVVELATSFDHLRPDVVVTVADRYETLATAVAASYMNIPTAHVQGGEITGSIDEKVRHAVTKLSTLHFVATEKARERVIRMGEEPEAVFVTGCPSIDLAATVLDTDWDRWHPFQQYGGVGPPLDLLEDYLVVMQHPVTTEYDEARGQVGETLAAVHELRMPACWFWPNVDAGSDGTSKGIRMFRERHRDARIHFFRRMAPEDFLRLAYRSQCVVGNSSVGIRECSFLGVPAVNIGTRQRGREREANVLDVAYDRRMIQEAIRRQLSNGRYEQSRMYGDGRAGERIAELLARCELKVEKRLAY